MASRLSVPGARLAIVRRSANAHTGPLAAGDQDDLKVKAAGTITVIIIPLRSRWGRLARDPRLHGECCTPLLEQIIAIIEVAMVLTIIRHGLGHEREHHAVISRGRAPASSATTAPTGEPRRRECSGTDSGARLAAGPAECLAAE